MPLSWDDSKHLLRMLGVAEELVASTPATSSVPSGDGFNAQLEALMQETHTHLVSDDEELAREFDRLVGCWMKESVPLELGAAALLGWLKAYAGTESYVEKQRNVAQAASAACRDREQTIGFKIRSPITRDLAAEQAGPAGASLGD